MKQLVMEVSRQADSPSPSLCIEEFKQTIENIKGGSKTTKIEQVSHLLTLPGMLTHHHNKVTKRSVFANCDSFEYPHEHTTCKKLTGENYDVVLVPKGYFTRHQKKFDVFLLRDHLIFECDLKCITSRNPDTIGKRIKEGSQQANRLIIDIASNIQKKELIIGLKTGCIKNDNLKEILLFYQSSLYRLSIDKILSRGIFETIK